ncbi:MAG: ABC transporter permease [Gemmatimonadota bacterium]
MRAVAAIVGREFRRLLRQRGRLLSSLARPLLWLFIIGSGFSGLVALHSGLSYRDFLLPGVVAMVLLFSSMLAALSTVYDRELGMMRMMLIAPISRLGLVVAKVMSSAAVGAVQGIALLLLVPAFGLEPGAGGLALTLAGVLLTSLTLAAIGMLLASRIGSIENFAVVMNFVLFPMFFLSGGLYPVAQLPSLLRAVALANPLTYGIDVMKHGLFGAGAGAFGGELPLGLDLGALAVAGAAATLLAVRAFSREERLAAMAVRPS